MISLDEETRPEETAKPSAAHIQVKTRTSDVAAQEEIKAEQPAADDEKVPPPASRGRAVKMSGTDWTCFPNQPSAGGAPPMTIANLKHLMDRFGITVRYNVVKKKVELSIPGYRGTDENFDNVALAHVVSLAAQCGLSSGQVPNFIAVLADENAYNPVEKWIKSKPWDETDRLPAFYNTLTVDDDYPAHLKCTLIRKWLLSAVAAALMPYGFRNRGVLTLQGQQGLGKTQWAASLVTDTVLRASVVKLDHHLDAYNKDSIIGAAAHWICEIGELDSSIRKDIARIKGVLTRDSDKVRLPYARAESEFPRRTVFLATVNKSDFLVDDTGNSRWWTIPVIAINYEHGIDMQQLFAQLACDFQAGKEWWLSPEEEDLLELQNRQHRTTSAIGELLMSHLDLQRIGEAGLPPMTPTELLTDMGYERPTNPQCRECAAFLRDHLGEPKRINGQNKWRIPVKGAAPDQIERRPGSKHNVFD